MLVLCCEESNFERPIHTNSKSERVHTDYSPPTHHTHKRASSQSCSSFTHTRARSRSRTRVATMSEDSRGSVPQLRLDRFRQEKWKVLFGQPGTILPQLVLQQVKKELNRRAFGVVRRSLLWFVRGRSKLDHHRLRNTTRNQTRHTDRGPQ